MPERVDIYVATGVASGVLVAAGHLRDALESAPTIDLRAVSWQGIDDGARSPADRMTITTDEVLVAVSEFDPTIPVHATWHDIVLDVGPYRVIGELSTLPGFDPGRALTRPSGEFVLLRDVRLARLSDAIEPVRIGGHAYINRYGVERVSADLMLGFFFPGASVDTDALVRPVDSDPPGPAPAPDATPATAAAPGGSTA